MSCCSGFVGGFIPTSSSAGGGGAPASVNPYSPPEQWSQLNVAASQTNVALSCLVSQNFDNIKMIRAGSIVGFATRLSTPITAGTLTVEVTLNGAGTGFTLVHTSASNASGGVATQAVGTDAYVASDLIGFRITTDAGFLPVTTHLEAWPQLVEVL